jgi:hypothetical protein
MINMSELKPGDILICKNGDRPFHALIFSPKSGEMGDVIHVGYGAYRSGVIKSNAEGLLSKLPASREIQVLRPLSIPGEAIADQAEFWLRQGIPFDEMRGADTVERDCAQAPLASPQHNVLQYLKLASRRETIPVKPALDYPYNNSGFVAMLCTAILNPSRPYNDITSQLLKWGRSQAKPGRPKGFTCIGFVLAILGCCALSTELLPVSSETGWVSLKNGDIPAEASPFRDLLVSTRQELRMPATSSRPGLHTLFTPEQLATFNLETLIEKLTPAIASLSPKDTTLREFLDATQLDPTHWANLGLLNRASLRTAFIKEDYRSEIKRVEHEIEQNRVRYAQDFHAPIHTRLTPTPRTSSLWCCLYSKESDRESIDTIPTIGESSSFLELV